MSKLFGLALLGSALVAGLGAAARGRRPRPAGSKSCPTPS